MTKLKGEPMTDPTPKPLAPLVTDAQILWRSLCAENGVVLEEQSFLIGAHWVRDIYEASRAKDHDLMRSAAEELTELRSRLEADGCIYTAQAVPQEDIQRIDALLTSLTERINTPK